MNSPRAMVLLAFALTAAVLLYLLAPILTPFLLAALLAYVANPLVVQLTRLRLPWTLAVVIVFVLFLMLLVVLLIYLVPMIQRQVINFAQNVPRYLDWVQRDLIPRLEDSLGQPLPVDFADLRGVIVAHWQEIADFVRTALVNMLASGFRIGLWVVNLLLVPVVTFYLLLDWDTVLKNTLRLFSPAARPTVARLAGEIDEVLGSFLRGQLLVMLVLAVVHSAGLMFIGLDLALPIGILAGLVSFVPFMGFIVGLTVASIAAYLQFQEPIALLWVFLVFFAANLLEGYVLAPRLVGSRIGLHPVAVIFAVLAGGTLFGFLGVLLALPAAAALKVWLRYMHQSYVVIAPKAAPQAPEMRRAGRGPEGGDDESARA